MSTTTTTNRPKTRLRRRLAFAAIMVVGTVGLIEVGALAGYTIGRGKTFSYGGMQGERAEVIAREVSSRGILGQVHPYVGYVEEPRERSDVAPIGRDRPVPISSYGYYDEAPPLHKRGPGRAIVGVLGGSVACLFAVNGADRLRADLAKDPAFAGKEVVVVNLAIGGYKEPQQLMTLGYLLALGAEFDVVLNIDGFNEVALYEFENAGSGVFPAFPRSWHARIEVANPRRGRLLGKLEYLNARRAGLARQFSGLPWRFSILGNVVWDALDRRAQAEAFQLQDEARGDIGGDYGRYVATGPKVAFATKDDLYRHLAAIWKNGSLQVDRLCRGNGIRYLHALQPNQYHGDAKPMGPEERAVAILDGHPYRLAVERGYPLLVAEGRDLVARGVPFHDLTRAFAGHPEPLYLDGCCHYNKAGYEILADAIAAALRADGPGPPIR